MTELAPGTRIRLTAMPEDPDPVPAGSEGTVIQHVNIGSEFEQVWVRWDNGRSLNVLPGVDRYEVIE